MKTKLLLQKNYLTFCRKRFNYYVCSSLHHHFISRWTCSWVVTPRRGLMSAVFRGLARPWPENKQQLSRADNPRCPSFCLFRVNGLPGHPSTIIYLYVRLKRWTKLFLGYIINVLDDLLYSRWPRVRETTVWGECPSVCIYIYYNISIIETGTRYRILLWRNLEQIFEKITWSDQKYKVLC